MYVYVCMYVYIYFYVYIYIYIYIRKARQNGENLNPSGAWPPWLATGAGHGPDGSAPHQYR